MSFVRFHDFSELYRAVLAETDERKKSSLLQEVERIIRNAPTDLPPEVSRQAKAA